ncbi:bifunctional hydroxymethylpyrimidine kinase/phosphomethylpyrimidine kinase [Wenzhouxiangella sp. AB-CW3]|uniref:bifunctional hydroxymethylpyrimidine kinase/phosphomethylpyrimidine kinase n=1 Tax=Wenzhouxiangella sp. AB-CW3 TaxID=2771012 RepID=UPI00168A520D|nr:bifunctional hydroxymethylpyrimidine kinase/phosphomethylpyrimidine kinase [Wenzhouxiangella sp. AB-CW3]QOC23590.1 bifunctional hydroxymethylpyrimidine kinase/phosphomethylpyrimidine kinase [Wenzhouxiangella sp. AB-CW3]
MNNRPCVLTIAGSDSCGGAGIQADLKTFTHHGAEGASVLTAITAQNTTGVAAVETLPPQMVRDQLDAVLSDLPIRAAKTGMLANAAIIETLAAGLAAGPSLERVIDPVMVATSGARLLDQDAERALIEHLLPGAALVTPNLPEAAALTGLPEETHPERLAEAILAMGCKAVLVKGGHARGARIEDLLVTPAGSHRMSHDRQDRRIHGTGCALSAAITARLAGGENLQTAVGGAIEWLQRMITGAWQPLHGNLAMLPFGASSNPAGM